MNINFFIRVLFVFLICFLFLVTLPVSAFESRYALVIGNSDYATSPLKNPVNDARDIAIALEKLGFQVDSGINISRTEMRQKIRDFGDNLNKADVGLFYFAGHGMQYRGENYLVPVSVDVQSEDEIADEAISVSSVLRKMENANNAMNIVILDACRNNPFARSYRSATQGLTIMDSPTGSFIAYATAPGNVAADGTGNNGLYTQHLLANITLPELSIEQVFKRVRIGVMKDTEGKQVPWENSSLLGEFQFTEPLESSGDNAAAMSKDYELEFWRVVEKKDSRAMYQAYLDKFPEGHFSEITKQLLKNYAQGKLSIRSNVFGDSVKINGEYKGATRLDVSLDPGEYQIEVEKTGYQTTRSMVVVTSEKNQLLEVKLMPEKSSTPGHDSRKMPRNSDFEVKTPPIPEIQVTENAGKTKLEPILGIEFVEIKAGCFTMGSPFLEEGRLPDENEHEVCLSKDFWMSRHEITQGQWQRVMGNNPSFFKGCGKNCPVERVSWNEVKDFIFKLNLKTGQTYRLPSEAEWEYAARAGTTGATYYGNIESEGSNNAPDLNFIAWYSGNSGVNYLGGKYCQDWDEKQFQAKRCGTHSAGLKLANPWGLYDMIGNVWEWTSDWYGSHSAKEKTDPFGAADGSLRVVKGGNWSDPLEQNRSAARYGFSPKQKKPHIGFRLVKYLE